MEFVGKPLPTAWLARRPELFVEIGLGKRGWIAKVPDRLKKDTASPRICKVIHRGCAQPDGVLREFLPERCHGFGARDGERDG
jgi:hypothetical protein